MKMRRVVGSLAEGTLIVSGIWGEWSIHSPTVLSSLQAVMIKYVTGWATESVWTGRRTKEFLTHQK